MANGRIAANVKLWVAVLLALVAMPLAAQQGSPRERISINDGWRFHQGDPEGLDVDLRYDARPEVQLSEDGSIFDTAAVDAEKVESPPTVLKRWILPTGNDLIADPAKRHQRPAGDPGSKVSFVQPGSDDSSWQSVTLPHDWAIDKPFLETGPYGGMGRLPSWGIGWYRRTLDIPASDAGRQVYLDVDGAMAYSTVWLNGHLVGGWPYGYNGWRVDLTPWLRPGERNQLAIRLDNPHESSRWYPGGGIYRNVWLVKTAPVHVAHWGSKVTTPEVSAQRATVTLETRIDNTSAAAAMVEATTEIFVLDAQDRITGKPVARIASATLSLAPGEIGSLLGETAIANPRLWGPPPTQQPNRYIAVTTLRQGGKVTDRYETRFGVRNLEFDPDRGVIVNGEPVKLHGVNEHHDLGALGAAFNERAMQRKLEILRDAGVNALRMAHNPPTPELLDLADRMGFLVVDEVFDVWQRRKAPLDFHLVFDDWHEQDLRAMMRRDFNHPSVIMWSVGNEVGEQYAGNDDGALARDLVRLAETEDGHRPIVASMNAAAPGSAFADAFDAIALNYQGTGVRTKPRMFQPFHEAYPGKIVFESESSAAYSSRGQYQFPVPGGISNPVRPGVGGDYDTKQVSAYELFGADFGGTVDRTWAAHDQNPFSAGEFVWTGFDYLGEPAPFYDSRSSYFGFIDLAGFPKDRFYAYKARWRPDVPFVHVFPHWTFPGREGEVTPVHAFTSGDEAELFVNGKSQGRQVRAPNQYRYRWDYVRYEPGEIEVVAYKDGKEWARQSVRTAGEATTLVVEPDRTAISADGKDLSYVAVSLADANGTFVPAEDRAVTFTIRGPGEIVATTNGDPTDFTPFPSHTRDLFGGRTMAIVRSLAGKSGTIEVTATVEGLAPVTRKITSRLAIQR